MELFAIYYLSPQYWQALVIHEIQASNLFIRENNDFFSPILEPSLTQNSRGFIKYKYDDL